MSYPNHYNNEHIQKIYQSREESSPGFAKYRNLLSSYYSKESLNKPTLLHAYVETNSSCNYACPSCTHGSVTESEEYNQAGAMPLNLFHNIVDQLVSLGCNSISLYNCNEPLLDRRIFDLVEYCRGKFFDIILMTNGSLLEDHHFQKLADSAVTRICFSIDANSERIYSKVRPSKNIKLRKSFNEIKSSISDLTAFLRNQKPDVITRASFVVSPENIPDALPFIKQWSSIVDIVELQDYHALPYNSQNIALNKKFQNLSINSCGAPFTTLQIRPNGEVYPCCTMYATFKESSSTKDLSIGNIKEQRLADIWNGTSMQNLRNDLLGDTPCDTCKTCMNNHYVEKDLHNSSVITGFKTN